MTLPPSSSKVLIVGMKPLSERDENQAIIDLFLRNMQIVGMKPLSERDENNDTLFPIHQPIAEM